jgi:hypothetical protein
MPPLKKIWKFVYGGIRYDPSVFLLFCISFMWPSKPVEVKVLTNEEFSKAIKNGRSVIRFGDGEMLLMTGRDIYFQPTSPAINKKLRAIIKNYSVDAPYIIGVTANKLADSAQTLNQAGTLKIWRLYRVFFKHRFDATLPYCTATYFYIKEAFEKNVMPHIKNRHIIWVSKTENFDEALTSYFSEHTKSVTYIEAPAADAYKAYEKIKVEVLEATHRHSLKPIVLLAAGPATKVLAYELSQMGIQCLDIGQGITVIAHETDRSDQT